MSCATVGSVVNKEVKLHRLNLEVTVFRHRGACSGSWRSSRVNGGMYTLQQDRNPKH